jgi:hypothetical protein
MQHQLIWKTQTNNSKEANDMEKNPNYMFFIIRG